MRKSARNRGFAHVEPGETASHLGNQHGMLEINRSRPVLWCPGCKSQDSVGAFGTGIWVGKRPENTDFRQGTARRIMLISPTASWDLHTVLVIFCGEVVISVAVKTLFYPLSPVQSQLKMYTKIISTIRTTSTTVLVNAPKSEQLLPSNMSTCPQS